jgi:molybdopterin-guanine dinucleotide biosynthesis protein A
MVIEGSRLVGLILAGGRSTRMGCDKATLPFGAGRLIDHMAATLRQGMDRAGHPGHVLVSGKVDGYHCIDDEVPGLGPMGGIVSAVNRLWEEPSRPRAVVIVPVDMPALTASTLARLVRRCLESGGDGAGYAGWELPVALTLSEPLPFHARAIAQEIGKPRARSVRGFLSQLDMEWMEAPTDEAELLNANTPEEFARYRP